MRVSFSKIPGIAHPAFYHNMTRLGFPMNGNDYLPKWRGKRWRRHSLVNQIAAWLGRQFVEPSEDRRVCFNGAAGR
jgi:hypothetical protein